MLTCNQLRNRRRALGTEERSLAVEVHRMQRERDAEPHELAFRPFRRFRKQRCGVRIGARRGSALQPLAVPRNQIVA